MSRYWSPAIVARGGRLPRRPEVGWIIAADRKPWVVLEVRDGDGQEVEYEVFVRPLDGTKHYGMRVPPHTYQAFHHLPEHFAVCHSCGELAPCREHERGLYAAREAERMEHELKLLPGCCPACQEPITSRQQTIDFPGEHVFNPFMPSDPVFHTRRKCLGGARRYENAWVAADPTRPRSLLTMYCEGTVIVHQDGSAECFGAANSDCPSVHADHRCYAACYTESQGCGRGCSRIGHPGTRIAGRPQGLRIPTTTPPKGTK